MIASTQGIICRPIFVSRSGGVKGGSSGSSSGSVKQDIDVKSETIRIFKLSILRCTFIFFLFSLKFVYNRVF